MQDFNIRTGAYYYANRIKASGGNLLLATGGYNGWVPGMDVVRIVQTGVDIEFV